MINDCVIIVEQRKIVTASADATLRIWDIFSEQLIYTIQLEKEIVSLTVNKEASLLASVTERVLIS